MVTFGDTPGVEITVLGGGINSAVVGREQKLVVFGQGDPQNGAANPNELVKIENRVDTANQFGSGTELADGLQKAYTNGANMDYLYGVMCEEVAVTGESIPGDGGQLSQAPIVEEEARITVTDGSSNEKTVNFVYESLPTAPADSGVNVNPLTGEFDAGDTNSYTVDYEYPDWSAAFDAADNALVHNEVGIYAPLAEANSVASTLVDKLEKLRPTFKLIRGVMGAQPNATDSNGNAIFNAQEYTDTIDHEAMFLLAPSREQNTGFTAIGAYGGMFAGHALTNPVYGDRLNGIGALTQTLSRDEENLLRDSEVIPVQDNAGDGGRGVTVEDNLSTSTASDYTRDFHRRRTIDQVILVGHTVGEEARDQRLIEDVLEVTKQNFIDELENFVDAGMIQPNGDTEDESADQQEEQKYFVEVTATEPDGISISVGITPTGIIKTVEETITVSEAPLNYSTDSEGDSGGGGGGGGS